MYNVKDSGYQHFKSFNTFGVLISIFTLLPTSLLLSQESIEFSEGLTTSCFSESSRSPIFINYLLFDFVHGNLTLPVEGGVACKNPDGTTSKWKKIERDEEGWFSDLETPSDWVFLPYESATETIMLLQTRGNSMTIVNGEPRVGDIYDYGTVINPVKIRKGMNAIYLIGSRGRMKASLSKPRSLFTLTDQDMTLPSIVVGHAEESWGAVRIVNATEEFQGELRVRCEIAGQSVETTLPPLPPLTTTKIGFRIPALSLNEVGKQSGLLTLYSLSSKTSDDLEFELEVVSPNDDRKETFISDIDGSVQYYAVSPPTSDTLQHPALILTLHGASVEAIGQARAYSPKDWAIVVAPTNRRPFGFDWEDWGRLDALEVLELAKQKYQPPPQQIYLTGHSMGGHGTWQLGATFPDKWAAIAPSAGWYSFWSYGGKEEVEEQSGIEEIIDRASNPSRTLELLRNYKHHGVYIFHGDADETVPVEQARFMRERLGTFHPDLCYYEYPGGKHWFGQSVDWPPLFDYFKWHSIPLSSDVNQVEFYTASPGISSRSHWVEILQQEKQGMISSVNIARDRESSTFTGTTDNVTLLGLDVADFEGEGSIKVELDSLNTLELPRQPGQERIIVKRVGNQWREGTLPQQTEKSPLSYGGFKYGMQRRMIFVYGTKGTADETALIYAKARYDAETWWYRANGAVQLVPDTAFDPSSSPDHNVVLYGNAATNNSWEALLGRSPVQVGQNSVEIGKHQVTGDDLAIYFLRPRPGSKSASVVVIGATGEKGWRTVFSNRYFISGAGYPDLLLISSEMLRSGKDGIKAAGFFGNDWSVEKGEFSFE
ncbi:MAG: prolyl oligopeptidase family serine peptidase [Candidatus Kapaibacterium sp.]